ncbi:MAG: M15 family metallopeptidase [Clostridia bacterium]|nr:M15 family metallopeptidase [Clostridia bacterium]
MANRSTPPKSFNTVKHSNRKERIKRQRRERIVLLAIIATLASLVLALIVFGICALVATVGANRPPKGSEQESRPIEDVLPKEVTYAAATRPNSAVFEGELLIVNVEHEYHFPTTEAGLKNIFDNRVKYQDTYNTYMVPNTAWKLQTSALDAFNAMMLKHYELFEDGSIKISSAYRSYEDQANSTTSSTPAGFSDHHTGLCIAIRAQSGELLPSNHWIYQNCHKYGFVIRYPNDKSEITGVSGYEYCLRYVGVAHATYMVENSLCLEEYVELLKSTYTSGNHLALTAADGNKYEIYYVPAAGGEISTFQLPKNRAYTVSGDNIGGFIVTVHLNQPIDE